MASDEERTADRRCSWLRRSSLRIVGLAAIVWVGIATASAAVPEAFNDQETGAKRKATDIQLRDTLVLVNGKRSEDNETIDNYTTGTVIARTTNYTKVLTCAHGYRTEDGSSKVYVVRQDGKKFLAKDFLLDHEHDVMIVVTDDLNIDPLPIADKPPRIGDKLYVCGFPASKFENYKGQWGKVTGWSALDHKNYVALNIEAEVEQGQSGGPVLNEQGQVIGTVTGRGVVSKTAVCPCLPRVWRYLRLHRPHDRLRR